MRLWDGGELYIIHTIGNFLNTVLMVNFLGCTFLGGHVFYEETTLFPQFGLDFELCWCQWQNIAFPIFKNSLGLILSKPSTTTITSTCFFCSNYQTILTICPSPPVNTKCLITGFLSIFFPSVGPCLVLDTSKCLINIFKEEKEGQREKKRRKEVREGGRKEQMKGGQERVRERGRKRGKRKV